MAVTLHRLIYSLRQFPYHLNVVKNDEKYGPVSLDIGIMSKVYNKRRMCYWVATCFGQFADVMAAVRHLSGRNGKISSGDNA